MNNKNLECLRKAGTAVLADVFDQNGLLPPVLANDLWSANPNHKCFAGPVYTVSGRPEIESFKSDPEKLNAIDAMGKGDVALWAGNGMQGVCCFGDLLASAMKARGVVGVVVDGGVRDLAFLRQLDLPVMVQYRTPAQAIGRWKVTAAQVPVHVRGALEDWITVHPGDVLVGDDDGVIVVPQKMVDRVAEQAARWEMKDQRAREDIVNGMKLIEALKKHGAL